MPVLAAALADVLGRHPPPLVALRLEQHLLDETPVPVLDPGAVREGPAGVRDARRALSDRTWVEEQNRRLIEEMLLEPERHKWRRVSAEDIGERGCRHWHVRPRWSFIGMLMGWWRVVISSGCPLAT